MGKKTNLWKGLQPATKRTVIICATAFTTIVTVVLIRNGQLEPAIKLVAKFLPFLF